MILGQDEPAEGNLGYKPPFSIGGNPVGPKRDHKQMDQMYQQLGNIQNLSRENQARLQNIIDKADGQDLDIYKVARHLQKQGNDDRDSAKPGGFVTGLQQFKTDMNNKKRGLGGNDDYGSSNNDRYGGSNYNSGNSNNNRWNFGNSNNNNQNNYNQNNYNKNYEDDTSATDKLFNNQGRQPGIGGRRKFVPPTKEGGQGYNGGGANHGGFQPGRSVVQHMVNNKTNNNNNSNNGQNEEKKGDGELDIMQDERYKNLDPRVSFIDNLNILRLDG